MMNYTKRVYRKNWGVIFKEDEDLTVNKEITDEKAAIYMQLAEESGYKRREQGNKIIYSRYIDSLTIYEEEYKTI